LVYVKSKDAEVSSPIRGVVCRKRFTDNERVGRGVWREKGGNPELFLKPLAQGGVGGEELRKNRAARPHG